MNDTVELAWRRCIGEVIEVAPAIARGMVIVSNEFGVVVAVELETGKLTWRVQLSGKLTSPVISSSEPTVIQIASHDGSLWTLAWDGSILGQMDVGSPVNRLMRTDDRLLLGCEDGQFLCLNASDCSTIWQTKLDGPIYTAPAISGSRIVVGDDEYQLYCLDLTNGQRLWQKELGFWVATSPCIVGNDLFCASHMDMCKLDLATGELHWRFETAGELCSSPAYSDGRIVFGGGYAPDIYCLAAADGALLWQIPTNEWVIASAIIVEHLAFISDRDDYFYALRVDTGEVVAKLNFDNDLWAFAATRNFVVGVGWKGDLYCYRTSVRSGESWLVPRGTTTGIGASPA